MKAKREFKRGDLVKIRVGSETVLMVLITGGPRAPTERERRAPMTGDVYDYRTQSGRDFGSIALARIVSQRPENRRLR